MRRTASLSRETLIFGALALGTIILAGALRYPSLFEPRWYGDEGIFAAVAQDLRGGQMLYSDAWDNKPPLIFYTYAAVQSLFGTGVMPLHAVTAIVVLATQAAVIAISVTLYGWRQGCVAGALFAFVMSTPIIEGNLAMTETYMVLPASLAVLSYVLASRRHESERSGYYLAAGVLLGVAAAYKQVAVFDAAALGLMIWITHRRPVEALAPLVAGFAAPQLLFAALFLLTGAADEYWYAVVGSLGLYSEISDADPFTRFAGYVPALLIAAYLVRRRRSHGDVTAAHFPLLWLGFALAGATSSAFAFPHYLQQAAPAAAIVVASLASLASLRERDALGRVMLGVGALLTVAVVFGQFSFAFEERRQLDPIDYYRTSVRHGRGDMTGDEYDLYFDGKVITVADIARLIEEDAAGSTLYAWSELPWLWPAADVTNPARYYTSFLGELVPGAKREILDDLRAAPPAYVVVSDSVYAPFPELDHFVGDRYVLLRAQHDWRLYRHRDLEGALEPAE